MLKKERSQIHVELHRKVFVRAYGDARVYGVSVVDYELFGCVIVDFEVIVHRGGVYAEVNLSIDGYRLLFRFLIDLRNLKFPENEKKRKRNVFFYWRKGRIFDRTFFKVSFSVLYCFVRSC